MVYERRGVWGLPGGKIDRGEEPFTAAVREFTEETGNEFNPKAYKELAKYTISGCRFYVGEYTGRLLIGSTNNQEITHLEFVRDDAIVNALHNNISIQVGKSPDGRVRRCMREAFQ